MSTYIALFRGINVGGNNILPMKELVFILQSLGLVSVRTYIQSGNVVFQSAEEDLPRLAEKISAAIETNRGFKPQVLLLDCADLERAVESNPFPEAEAEPNTLHMNFLASIPENPDLCALENIKQTSERFKLIGKVFYLHAPDGIARSKLAANAERLLGVAMTGRNWRTVSKLQAMVQATD